MDLGQLFVRVFKRNEIRSCTNSWTFLNKNTNERKVLIEMDAQSLVFEYFFQIGAGAAAGITCVILPAILVYRWIANRKTKRVEMD